TCSECGYVSPKWLGRCPECGSWGTLQESMPATASANVASAAISGQVSKGLNPTSPAQPISKVASTTTKALKTGIREIDRVLGESIRPGTDMLTAGEPGMSRSTLLLEMPAWWTQPEKKPRTAFYGSAEESLRQVRRRAKRSHTFHETLYLATE